MVSQSYRLLLIVLLFASAAAAGTYYVAPCGNDSWAGTSSVCASPNGPKRTIQAAINASAGGDTINVADGTYTGTSNKELDPGGKNITLRSTGGPTVCIIDCEGSGRGFYLHTSETADCIIEGFTIKNALPSSTGSYRGAIRCDASSPTIRDCRLLQGSAGYFGGALYCTNGGNPTVTDCVIMGNIDGGVGCVGSSPTLTRCRIEANVAWGLSASSGSSPTLINCVIRKNVYTGISSSGSCGWSAINCAITEHPGKGVYCTNGDNVSLVNCILWGNLDSEIAMYSATVRVAYNVIEGGQASVSYDASSVLNWDVGNIDADPKLTADRTHIQADSPCIDAGDPAGAYAGRTDYDGEPLAGDGQPDIGPDEFVDTDDDGLPGWFELRYAGSSTGLDAAADGDGDGLVNLDEYTSDRDPTREPKTFYVNGSVGSDTYDGLAPSWNGLHGPKRTIQPAINVTSTTEGDTVVLSDGTYTSDLNKNLELGGRAITLRSQNGPANCTINCGNSGRAFVLQQGEGPGSVLEGLTLTGAALGAIRCVVASPTIRNCIMTANSTNETYGAGGLYARASSPVLTDCVITNNSGVVASGLYFHSCQAVMARCTVTGNTGAWYAVYSANRTIEMSDCKISQNTGRGYVAQDVSGTIARCEFVGNSQLGAGFYDYGTQEVSDCIFQENREGGFYSDCLTTVRDCAFIRNRGTSGGAIMLQGEPQHVINCLFAGNYASSGGGAGHVASSPARFTNCVFVGNTSSGGAAALHVWRQLRLTNCVFGPTVGTAIHCEPDVDADIYNSVFWTGATRQLHLGQHAAASLYYTDVQGGEAGIYEEAYSYATWTPRVMNFDPLWRRAGGPGGDGQWGTADDDYGNLRLRAGSPCIDAGDNTRVPADTPDLDGDGDTTEPLPFDVFGRPRFSDDAATIDSGIGPPPIVDLGAAEYFPQAAADWDGDDDVDAADLEHFTACMSGPNVAQTNPDCASTDFDEDSDVDQTDFGFLQRCLSGPEIPVLPGCN